MFIPVPSRRLEHVGLPAGIGTEVADNRKDLQKGAFMRAFLSRNPSWGPLFMPARASHLECEVDDGRSKLDMLRSMLRTMRETFRGAVEQSSSVGEYLSDREGEGSSAWLGDGTSIYDSSLVLVMFGRQGHLDRAVHSPSWQWRATCHGDHCSISAGVQIYTLIRLRWALDGGASNQ
jgi:hypothetical protein